MDESSTTLNREDDMTTTLNRVEGRDFAPSPNRRPHLVVITNADEPQQPSSRHILDGIDEVRFGRGPRAAIREGTVLDLRFPDPRMSSDHGRLLRTPTGWTIDDPLSKNGVVVDSKPARKAPVISGSLLELGHTFIGFSESMVEDDAKLDMLDGERGIAAGVLTTFDGALGSAFANLVRVAKSDVSIVLLGETGTGKERVARTLHEHSGRTGPFVAINCGALPPSLIESELFGHRRGAFTGAIGERSGLVRSADGGTLFLDEIAELPPASQAAFLRVLQEREVVPVGDDRPVKVDVRLVAATLRDLDDLVEKGTFRRDLYARLFGLTVQLPSLRERRVDFGIVLRSVLASMANGHRVRFTCAATRAMLSHHWPLNIRELEKVLSTASVLAGDREIDVPHLDLARRSPSALAMPMSGLPPTRKDLAQLALRERLTEELGNQRGNVVAVARVLGVRRTQIYRWAHRLDIDLTTFRR